MFGDGDLTLSTLKLWSTLEISRVLLEFADVVIHHGAYSTLPGYVPLVLAGTREACNVHSLSYNTSRIIGPSDEQSSLMWLVEGA